MKKEPDVGHEVGEAEEAVCLGVLPPLPAGVGGEHVVDGAHDLVHALHVALPRVQLGVEEQDPFHHFPVGLVAQAEGRVVST